MCYSSTLRTDTVCNTDIQHDHDSVKAIDLTKKKHDIVNKISTYSAINFIRCKVTHYLLFIYLLVSQPHRTSTNIASCNYKIYD